MKGSKREFVELATRDMMASWLSSSNASASRIPVREIVKKALEAWRELEMNAPDYAEQETTGKGA